MAGIGFRLRALMDSQSYFGIIQAYGFSGIISSGPWILSIVGILLIGLMNTHDAHAEAFVAQFQISVTYLMAFSLILTSPLQLSFTRFIADKIYQQKEDLVLPNLLGALLLVVIASGVIGTMILAAFFSGTLLYRVLMLAGFVILCAIWIVVIILSGLKSYRGVLLAFFVGYALTVLASIKLNAFGLEGLLGGFVIGQAVLFFILLYLVLRNYSSEQLIAFHFLERGQIYPELVLIGILYNLAIWADKFLFWFNPKTSAVIIPPLRTSEIYDLPIFLAYLSILPGMATFLIRMETDFAEKYEAFYSAITGGKPLQKIIAIYDEMLAIIDRGLIEIAKVQGMTVIVLLAFGENLLKWVGISPNYKVLLNIDVVAVSVQVLLLALLNLLFYFDYRRDTLKLCSLFALSNIGFTLLTQHFGPALYGYGFAAAIVLTTIVGLVVIVNRLHVLLYETFMLR